MILLESIFSLVSIHFILNILNLIQIIIILLAEEKNSTLKYCHYLTILFYLWNGVALHYFSEVFISSLVYCSIESEKLTHTEILKRSLKNTLYALGSICFGSLVLALVKTLRVYVKDQKYKECEQKKKPSALQQILFLIASILLSLLEDLVKFANFLAYPYLAVTGCSYTEAVKNSFDEIYSKKCAAFSLIGSICFILYIFAFCSAYAMVSANYTLIKYLCPQEKEAAEFFIKSSIFIAFFCILSVVMASQMVYSSSLAIIFCSATKPDSLLKYSPETYNAIIQSGENGAEEEFKLRSVVFKTPFKMPVSSNNDSWVQNKNIQENLNPQVEVSNKNGYKYEAYLNEKNGNLNLNHSGITNNHTNKFCFDSFGEVDILVNSNVNSK